MEYEKKFWIKSRVPTGLSKWPKAKKRHIIPVESHQQIKQLLDEGKTFQDVALMMGCSAATIRKLKETL